MENSKPTELTSDERIEQMKRNLEDRSKQTEPEELNGEPWLPEHFANHPKVSMATSPIVTRWVDNRTDEEKAAAKADREERERVAYLESRREQYVRQMKNLAEKIGVKYVKSDFTQRVYFGNAEEQERQRIAYGKVDSFVANLEANLKSGRNLCLVGARGTGKDYALTHAMKRAIQLTQRHVNWWDGARLFTAFKHAATGKADRTFGQLTEGLSESYVLAISDPLPPIGCLSEFLAGALLSVIDYRYRHDKPTWVTLNVRSRKDAEERLGPLIVDRLFENAERIFFDWGSYREFASK